MRAPEALLLSLEDLVTLPHGLDFWAPWAPVFLTASSYVVEAAVGAPAASLHELTGNWASQSSSEDNWGQESCRRVAAFSEPEAVWSPEPSLSAWPETPG